MTGPPRRRARATDALPRVEGVGHRDVSVRGARFHVATAGPDDGPPVVLLHGWPQHWFAWRAAIPALAQAGARVIAPDLRGFGWSEVTPRGYRKRELALAVLAILDASGIDEFALAGHDWGGFVAFLLALDQPARVRRLALLNTCHGFPKHDLRTLAALRSFWYMLVVGSPLLGPALVRRGGIERAIRSSGEVTRAWSEEDLRWFMDRTDPHASQQLYGSFVFAEVLRTMLGRELRRLHPPTLFLYGDADRAIRPDLIRGLEDHADDYRLQVLPGVGHFCLDERPDLVVAPLVEHLTAPG